MSKDIMNTAFIFPGQGSQDIGMGKSLYLNSIAARDVFDEVDEILGRNLSDLMFEGDKDELTRTENAQPAILATSIALWKSIEETTDTISTPSIVAGHSLGEYSALTVAGVFSIADAVKLVLERCKQMQMAYRTGDNKEVARLQEILNPEEDEEKLKYLHKNKESAYLERRNNQQYRR